MGFVRALQPVSTRQPTRSEERTLERMAHELELRPGASEGGRPELLGIANKALPGKGECNLYEAEAPNP
jgi:hypothetical protein